jgi:hypothetical protein
MDTTTFPVASCGACSREVVAGYDLDANDELVAICTRCKTPLAMQSGFRMLGAAAIRGLGYDLDDEGGGGGCGTGGGGCSSCGSGASTSASSCAA